MKFPSYRHIVGTIDSIWLKKEAYWIKRSDINKIVRLDRVFGMLDCVW